MRYPELALSGELARRANDAVKSLARCLVCPEACGVDRMAGQAGRCRAGRLARISSYGPHFGEERPLVGQGGSGTIFFAYCNLRCVFCQNYDISHLGQGEEVSAAELSQIMLSLQEDGCENVNLVTPTHYVPQILEALELAAEAGLEVPLVYNTGSYECMETLRLLDGVVDIYLPDTKYADRETARKYSGIDDYPARMYASLKEMYRQVGELQLDARGVATRGLIVRHLVMPGGLAGTVEIMRFIAEELSPRTYVNLMDQYYPAFRTGEFPEINRRVNRQEFREAVETARTSGLTRVES